MTVIVLHPSDELKILNISKQISTFLSSNSIITYRNTPLWIPFFQTQFQFSFDDDLQTDSLEKTTNLKELANKISNIQIHSPQINDDIIFCPVTITFNKQDFFTKLIISKIYNQKTENTDLSNTEILQKKIAASETFPMQLKIFRFAKQIQLSKNSFSLSDFVWKKL